MSIVSLSIYGAVKSKDHIDEMTGLEYAEVDIKRHKISFDIEYYTGVIICEDPPTWRFFILLFFGSYEFTKNASRELKRTCYYRTNVYLKGKYWKTWRMQ